MAYGTIKVDTITFTDAGVDKSVTISGLVQNPTFSGNITVTGTVSGNTIQGQTVSGATITGGAAAFTTVTGGVATITSGVFALGSASNPSISFNGDANSGLYSPGADQVAVATNGTGRLFVDASGNVQIGSSFAGFGNGSGVEIERSTTSTLRLTGNSGVGCEFFNTGSLASIQTRSAIPFTIQTNELERLRITSAGLVGIGTSSPAGTLHVNGQTYIQGTVSGGLANSTVIANSSGQAQFWALGSDTSTTGSMTFVVARSNLGSSLQAVTIDSSGRVGIGTTPSVKLHVYESGSAAEIRSDNGTVTGQWYQDANAGTSVFGTATNHSLVVRTNGNERARIDTSGRLLVGTSSAGGTELIQVQGTSGGSNLPGGIALRRSSLANGDDIGYVNFTNASGNIHAGIKAFCDGSPGASDYPGALVFLTTADGASSPTERMRITNGGAIIFAKTSSDFGAAGISYEPGSSANLVRDGGTAVAINRLTSDGSLVDFYQANNLEGNISVSGSTVSYNGAHLSRWSQILGIDPYNKAVRPEILRGTVMSNLDEMCDWTCPTSGECQDNEQLNKTKISDVEGDKNVAGIFQDWDDDDDTWVNDYYLAMTGDFVIRIAAGTSVERGDLLMSAGDGTAKPQSDDLVRSCTVAKVTSTNVSCTHEDGSYCVPCVLMAC